MSIFDIFRRKRGPESIIEEQAERVRRELFPNGMKDCIEGGKRISAILEGRISPRDGAPMFASLMTIKHVSPVMCAAIFRDRVIKYTDGIADDRQALDIFCYICGMEGAPFKRCPGDSLDAPFYVEATSEQDARKRHFDVMEEAWGSYEKDWALYMHIQHTHRGRLLDCYSLVLNDGSRVQYYFARDDSFGKN